MACQGLVALRLGVKEALNPALLSTLNIPLHAVPTRDDSRPSNIPQLRHVEHD